MRFFLPLALTFQWTVKGGGHETSTITTALQEPGKISVEFLDFDKTITTGDFGAQVLANCDPGCSYSSCTCGPGDMVYTLDTKMGMSAEQAMTEAMGGEERLNRFESHMQIMAENNVDVYIVATAMYTVPVSEWANFIHEAFAAVGMDGFVTLDKILVSADPKAAASRQMSRSATRQGRTTRNAATDDPLSGWRLYKKNGACGSTSNGDIIDSFSDITLEWCMNICTTRAADQSHVKCVAIDFFADSGWCNILSKNCDDFPAPTGASPNNYIFEKPQGMRLIVTDIRAEGKWNDEGKWCTGCPAHFYQDCPPGYAKTEDNKERGCGFLGCNLWCVNVAEGKEPWYNTNYESLVGVWDRQALEFNTYKNEDVVVRTMQQFGETDLCMYWDHKGEQWVYDSINYCEARSDYRDEQHGRGRGTFCKQNELEDPTNKYSTCITANGQLKFEWEAIRTDYKLRVTDTRAPGEDWIEGTDWSYLPGIWNRERDIMTWDTRVNEDVVVGRSPRGNDYCMYFDGNRWMTDNMEDCDIHTDPELGSYGMGLEHFCGAGERDATDIYSDCTEKNGMLKFEWKAIRPTMLLTVTDERESRDVPWADPTYKHLVGAWGRPGWDDWNNEDVAVKESRHNGKKYCMYFEEGDRDLTGKWHVADAANCDQESDPTNGNFNANKILTLCEGDDRDGASKYADCDTPDGQLKFEWRPMAKERGCRPCNCLSHDERRLTQYTNCSPDSKHNKCDSKDFCVQCGEDGYTAMPGHWSTHQSVQCAAYQMTYSPTQFPTLEPTERPTGLDATPFPTESPTQFPTKNPTDNPTEYPTRSPTDSPTDSPTESPTPSPTEKPTRMPTPSPTESPTDNPTESPTVKPTEMPSRKPTESPTPNPTRSPTDSPTESPTPSPTESPTKSPTESPTPNPTPSPTPSPTEPLPELPTDMGELISGKLTELGLEAGDALYADDNTSNFVTAVQEQLAANTLHVQPAAGLTSEDMTYIEGLATSDKPAADGISTFSITRNLEDVDQVGAVFFDFDKTFTITDFGRQMLLECDPYCNYESCDCDGPGQLASHLATKNQAYSIVIEALGGADRKNKLQSWLSTAVYSKCQKTFIVSTSYYSVPAKEWREFIFQTLSIAGLTYLLPKDFVLALNDPGEGIKADKGAVIEGAMATMGLQPGDAIFMDDSETNFLSAVKDELVAETIYVQPREGVPVEVLEYVNRRMRNMCSSSFASFDDYALEAKLAPNEAACDVFLGKWVQRRGVTKCAPPKKKRVRCQKLRGTPLCLRAGCEEPRNGRCLGRPSWAKEPKRLGRRKGGE